jgi:Ni/Co efflux regulator RcnB
MKRLLVAAAAALTLVGPLAATTASADPPRHERMQNDHRNNNNARRSWDQSRDNGYYVGSQWHRGAPSAAMQRRADFRPGWQQWRRGERLSAYQRAHYQRIDYRAARLHAPPRGYQYVRDDHSNVLLVAIATGVIASIIASR